jgi:hypothetical protein
VHYLNVNYGIKSWLFTKDHKRIALLYLTSTTLFFFLGGAAAVVMRLELLTPPSDLVLSETYNPRFAHFLRRFKHCGRVSGAKEVPHGRDPDHCQ